MTSENARKLETIDLKSGNVVKRLQLSPKDRPCGLVFSHDGRIAYVATGRGNRVAAADTATSQIVREFQTGARPWWLALNRAVHLAGLACIGGPLVVWRTSRPDDSTRESHGSIP